MLSSSTGNVGASIITYTFFFCLGGGSFLIIVKWAPKPHSNDYGPYIDVLHQGCWVSGSAHVSFRISPDKESTWLEATCTL